MSSQGFDCPHGRGAYKGLESKCEICHLEAEVERLEAELVIAREREAKLRAAWPTSLMHILSNGRWVHAMLCGDYASRDDVIDELARIKDHQCNT